VYRNNLYAFSHFLKLKIVLKMDSLESYNFGIENCKMKFIYLFLTQ